MAEMHWTAEQTRAILAAGPTMLAANAGTGKTTTVIGKILWRLGVSAGTQRDNGQPLPACPVEQRLTLPQIAAITFTEKAAYDLKRKLRAEIIAHAPELVWDIDRAAIGTIHGFCGDILREHALRFGIDPGFRVLDERDARLEHDRLTRDAIMTALTDGNPAIVDLTRRYRLSGHTYSDGVIGLVRTAFRDLRWHPARYQQWCAGETLDRHELARLAGVWNDKDDIAFEHSQALLGLARTVLADWLAQERRENVRDFDSLILTVRDLLTGPDGGTALAGIRQRLGLLVIDEFQDTDGAQRDIAFAISGLGSDGQPSSGCPQLFVVGDAKQSIYGFRGADIGVWNDVQSALGDANRLALTENFRSDPALIEYVNTMCDDIMNEHAARVRAVTPGTDVEYAPLVPARNPVDHAEVEWLATPDKLHREQRLECEAELVAARIRDMVIDPDRGDTEGIQIVDPDTGERRDCTYGDVAILFRARSGIEEFTRALQHYGVPYYLAGDAGLVHRQEVLDLLTLLRVLDNPQDDLHVFGWLRSPFVGLRDEVVARIRFEMPSGPLLRQARRFLTEGSGWPPFPEHPSVETLEREALENGLDLLHDLIRLRTRVHPDRLIEEALDRSGYRLHLQLLDQPAPRLANMQRFVSLLQGYRRHTVGSFLELWQKWEHHDLAIPQAALFSKGDNVVTLSTIHGAKGLEWPVVCLVDAHGRFSDRTSNNLLCDRELGPVLCLQQKERGDRTARISERCITEERAEETRLLYVAATRARDRLIVSGPETKRDGRAEWLARAPATRTTTTAPAVEIPPLPLEPTLEWIDHVSAGDPRPMTRPIHLRTTRRTRSATELMTRARNVDEWAMQYLHGVIPPWYFIRAGGDGLSARIRGTIVHGVLEQIQREQELAELLDLAIGTLDEPDLEEKLATGSEYRRSLEEEIRQVVQSDPWRWYVEGPHHRELSFVHFRPAGRWRVGAFDLYRPDAEHPVIIDFKTHDIQADAAATTAKEYAIQAAVYQRALQAAGHDAEVHLHFTRPNVVVPAGRASGPA